MKKSLAALAFGTLGLGMAEFGMMSILSVVAAGLNISIPEAGHFISVYALGVCSGVVVFIGKPTVKNPADYSDVHYVYRQLSGRYSS